MDEDNLFDLDLELPNQEITNQSNNLIGFDDRYLRIRDHLRMILSPDDIKEWSKKLYGKYLPICDIVSQRQSIFIFFGDVGTGKTVTAQCAASKFSEETGCEGRLLKLSTRIRGHGLHGEMSQLIHNAFAKLEEAIGKRRLGFLLIDEADALSSSRVTEQMHQEEKAAVNTLVQKLDDLRRKDGRAAVFFCTNRLGEIDPAVTRRAALSINFARPNFDERRELLKQDLDGLGISNSQIEELAQQTGSSDNHKVGYTYSDFRLRMLPDAITRVFPDQRLTYEVLRQSIANVEPSPEIK